MLKSINMTKRVIESVKQYGLQKLEKAGYIAGRTAAIVKDGFTHPEQPYDPTNKESVCRNCWCNTCAKLLDGCDAFPPSPDGARPLPCAECRAKDCAPLMPKVRPAECGTYESVPEDCAACWCAECANFEQCRVSKAGYYPEAGLCPCVGCEPSMIYMPQQTPPTCGQFQARFER